MPLAGSTLSVVGAAVGAALTFRQTSTALVLLVVEFASSTAPVYVPALAFAGGLTRKVTFCEVVIVCGSVGDATLSHDDGIAVPAPPHVWPVRDPVVLFVTVIGVLTTGSAPPPVLVSVTSGAKLTEFPAVTACKPVAGRRVGL